MPVFLSETEVTAAGGQFALTIDFNAFFGIDILPLNYLVRVLSWSYRTDGTNPHAQTLVAFDPNGVVADGILCVDEVNNLNFLEACGDGVFVVPRVTAVGATQGDCFRLNFVTTGKTEDATFRCSFEVVGR